MTTQQPHRLTEITRATAHAALDLHRVARAAEEISGDKSPVTVRAPGESPRPTEETALCPRRAHVVSEMTAVRREISALTARLERALDAWQG